MSEVIQYPLYIKDGKVVIAEENKDKYFIRKAPIDGASELGQWDSVGGHLRSTKVVVIDSSNSGTGRSDDRDPYKSLIRPVFEELEIIHEYILTGSASTITDTASKFSEEEAIVIFISGDTLINEFINGLSNSSNTTNGKLILFHIPAGTGNSLSLSLDIYSVVQAFDRLLKPVETVKFNLYEAVFPKNSYLSLQEEKVKEVETLTFVVVLSWGFHASLVADSDTPELRKHGLQRFQIAAQNNLADVQKYVGDATAADGTKFEGPFAYFVLTPSKRFEKPFEILPKGNVKDDKLWLVLFNTVDNDKEYIMDIMKEVYDKGSHVDDKRVTYKSFSKGDTINLKISKENPKKRRRFCVDGSIIQVPDGEQDIYVRGIGNKKNGWDLYLIT